MAQANALEDRDIVAVHEADVAHVERVLEILEVVAIAAIGIDLDHAVEMLELGLQRELGRRAGAEEGEDQAEVLTQRIGGERDLVAEGVFFRRLLDAGAGAVELPAVIEAAQRIALDPAGRQARAAMRAARVDEMRRSGPAAVEREVFAHDADGDGASRLQVDRVIDRLPELAQVTARGCTGSGAQAILAAGGKTNDG